MSGPQAHGEPAKLPDHPFLRGLAPEFLTALAAAATERSFDPGDLLLREGEPAREFLLLLHGKVALEIATTERPRLTIQTVGPGEVLGWSWLLSPPRWKLDARALKTTKALAINGAALRRALERHPSDGYQFLLRLLPVVAERLDNTRLQLLDIHGT